MPSRSALIASDIRDLAISVARNSPSDPGFLPYAAAVLSLRRASELTADMQHALRQELATRKRLDVLSDAAGVTLPPRALTLVAKAQWAEFRREDWQGLLGMIEDDQDFVLGHLSRITRTLVMQWNRIPDLLRIPAVLELLNTLDVPSDRWRRLETDLRSGESGSTAELLRLAAQIRTPGDFWDFCHRCQGEFWRRFSLPAVLETSPLLEPLGSALELQAEGLRMRNCLGTRSSRVLDGSRIYFRSRSGDANAELVRRADVWIPGAVLGPDNSPVDADRAAPISAELTRLAQSMPSPADDTHLQRRQQFLGELEREALKTLSEDQVDVIARLLASIRGRSRSWFVGAYLTVIEPGQGFVQFMASPDGTEFLCEIQSHRYSQVLDQRLSAADVELIERMGFVWPVGKNNFISWFAAEDPASLRQLAALTLGILQRLFGWKNGQRLEMKWRVP